MLRWLSDLTNYTYFIMIIYYFVLAIFLFSRRMNARLEPSPSAGRLLPQLARTVMPAAPDPEGSDGERLAAAQPPSDLLDLMREFRRRLSLFLGKLDWLLHDKWKVLPDAQTGRRMNVLILVLIPWLVSMVIIEVFDSPLFADLIQVRYGGMVHAPQLPAKIARIIFLLFLCWVLFISPLALMRKNREFYFDITALFWLMFVSGMKFTSCWYYGCCFGIPSAWGVYNPVIEETVFPLQLFEFATGMLLFIVCILFMLFAKSYKPGRACSFCLISYLLPRFFWEFLRYHGGEYRAAETVRFFGLSTVHIVCIVGVLCGVAWLLLLPVEKKLMDRFSAFVAGRLHMKTAQKKAG